jgi:hypothetical protein
MKPVEQLRGCSTGKEGEQIARHSNRASTPSGGDDEYSRRGLLVARHPSTLHLARSGCLAVGDSGLPSYDTLSNFQKVGKRQMACFAACRLAHTDHVETVVYSSKRDLTFQQLQGVQFRSEDHGYSRISKAVGDFSGNNPLL